jgi:serine/threonine protein kinase
MIDVIKKEIEILKKLNHENIVKFHYYFEESHYVYVVLEYIEGRTLGGILKRTLSNQ